MAEIRRGRPRSEQSRRAVLEATRDLLEANGYDKLSIEGIAARAAVGKQTVYRWWASKAAVVADAVLDGFIPMAPLSLADTGDLSADLTAWLDQVAKATRSNAQAGLIRALAAAVSTDEPTGDRLWERFTGPDRQAVIERLQSGVESGQVRADADLAVTADLIAGVTLFSVMARKEPSDDFTSRLVPILLSGIVPRTGA